MENETNNREKFFAALSHAGNLMGRKVETKQAEALWKELECENIDDTVLAIKDMAKGEYTICLKNILFFLSKHITIRIEKQKCMRQSQPWLNRRDIQEDIPRQCMKALTELFGQGWAGRGDMEPPVASPDERGEANRGLPNPDYGEGEKGA